LRILVVATAIRLPDRHGGSTHVAELSRHLSRHGEVLVLGQRGSTSPGVVGIGSQRRWPLWMRRLLPRLQLGAALEAVRSFGPEAIYERGSSYGLGALLSERLGIPLICMVLDEHYSERSLARAGKVIATTERVVPEHVRGKWVRVSWGANSELFAPEVEPMGRDVLPEFDGPTIAYAGSLKRWHDLDLMVDVAARLKSRSMRFLVVGDGPERSRIEGRIQSEGLEGRFVFTGAVDYTSVPRWLQRAEVCIAPFRPSSHDASRGVFTLDPLKVFEYLALGKPTVTTETDNIGALLGHEKELLLVREGDAAGFARAIERLLDDPAGAITMARAGREKVLERHTWAAHAAHLHQLFEELVAA
jgi:glycosyltransferase involved in cell wall biosynthesis